MSEDVKCELDRLMDLFKEPEPKPLTAAEIEDAARAERLRYECNFNRD